MATEPTSVPHRATAPIVTVDATYKDPKTGSLYVHKDLEFRPAVWADEDHIPPPHGEHRFGGVESWVEFVKTYSSTPDFPPFLTWNESGMLAVLDFHASVIEPGRCQFKATYPFVKSRQWTAWKQLAGGQAVSQADAIEALEDRAEDIVEPTASEVMNLLSHLKTTVNKAVELKENPDGTRRVSASSESTVAARGGTADLPETIKIGIPVLKGHVGKDGKAVTYGMTVRLRANVSDKGMLSFRFSIPNAEATLEDALADRVDAAKTALGAEYKLLRAAD